MTRYLQTDFLAVQEASFDAFPTKRQNEAVRRHVARWVREALQKDRNQLGVYIVAGEEHVARLAKPTVSVQWRQDPVAGSKALLAIEVKQPVEVPAFSKASQQDRAVRQVEKWLDFALRPTKMKIPYVVEGLEHSLKVRAPLIHSQGPEDMAVAPPVAAGRSPRP